MILSVLWHLIVIYIHVLPLEIPSFLSSLLACLLGSFIYICISHPLSLTLTLSLSLSLTHTHTHTHTHTQNTHSLHYLLGWTKCSWKHEVDVPILFHGWRHQTGQLREKRIRFLLFMTWCIIISSVTNLIDYLIKNYVIFFSLTWSLYIILYCTIIYLDTTIY